MGLEMADEQAEFNSIDSLRAEALGEPGSRTFRILVSGGGRSAVLWLEKDLLFQLSLAVKRLLTTVAEAEDPAPDDTEPSNTPGPNVEMQIGKLQLGHHGGSGKFLIEAYDAEADEESPPAVRVWANRGHLDSLATEALDVCAAGRPLCPLCGGPIDKTGHACPRRNGHSKMAPPERPE